ncbi:N-acetylmuramic acid 6-phosphate etherase [Orenia metallireducens]|uniref:N-acetylmuramic acid 6-phosphate etherase n=1 Tax=Orenia metallireducens TaxID=1413210 RepID=A0A285GGQ7_9FIRM|nr:N-acetylmuramic acid 6-phosphate etherase [Orenia metallireducens]PRX30474.1 N-acetylmuramic acid 6-phosphate etherase [Orenia metallireducens]SNY22752.1 N-acetylmuramic acid 6-phosphate etherase [Orenia metallireducens]
MESKIITEGRNQNTVDIDTLTTIEIIEKINDEDKKVAVAVEREKGNIAKAVDCIVKQLNEGGRLIYIGSGTSGRLGVLDAVECPSTFGIDNGIVQGIISGGKVALSMPFEETEDDEDLAIKDLDNIDLTKKDIIVGISASGNTPYVVKAVEYAKDLGARTISIICNKNGKLQDIADICIAVNVGPEVIMGSTRMKAGTAQKMVLNMLSTASMVKLGKVYSNLMIDVKPINKKLEKRIATIVQIATEVEASIVEEVLKQCNYNGRLAIIMIKKGVNLVEAKKILTSNEGIINQQNILE